MRAAFTRWLPADIDLLRRLVGEGKTNREIALAMGRTESSVTSTRHRVGLLGENRTWGPESIRQLAELRAQGLTKAQIAEVMGCPPSTIKGALDRFGITHPEAAPPRPKAATISGKLAGPVSLAQPYTRAERAWAAANIRDRQAKLIAGLTTGELVHVFEDAPVRPGRIDVRAA